VHQPVPVPTNVVGVRTTDEPNQLVDYAVPDGFAARLGGDDPDLESSAMRAGASGLSGRAHAVAGRGGRRRRRARWLTRAAATIRLALAPGAQRTRAHDVAA